MNKADLIDHVVKTTGLSKKDSEKAVAATIGGITEELKSGNKVSLVGFGTFEVRERAARNGINPANKQPMKFPATKVPAFKAGKSLKDAVK